jgi:hypothetical protein
MDRWMNIQTKRWTEGWKDGWIDRYTYKWRIDC